MRKKPQITGRTGSSIFNRLMGLLTDKEIDQRNDKATTIMETLGADSQNFAKISEIPAFGRFSEKDNARYLIGKYLAEHRDIGTGQFVKILNTSDEEREKFGIAKNDIPHQRTLGKWRETFRDGRGQPKAMRDGRALRSGRGSSITDLQLVLIIDKYSHRQTVAYRLHSRIGSLAKKIHVDLCHDAAQLRETGQPCEPVPSVSTVQRVIRELNTIDERYLRPVRLGKLFDDFGMVTRRPNEGVRECQTDTAFFPFKIENSEGKLLRPSVTTFVDTDVHFLMACHTNEGSPSANTVRFGAFSAFLGTEDELTTARVRIERLRFDGGGENRSTSFHNQLRRLGITPHRNDRKKPGQNGAVEVAGGYVKHMVTSELETMINARAPQSNKGIYIGNFEHFRKLVAQCVTEINKLPVNGSNRPRVLCYEDKVANQTEPPLTHTEVANAIRAEVEITVNQYGVKVGGKYFHSPAMQAWNGQKVLITFPADPSRIYDVRAEVGGENYELFENHSTQATQDLYENSAASTSFRKTMKLAADRFEEFATNHAKHDAPMREFLGVQEIDTTAQDAAKQAQKTKLRKPKPAALITHRL